MVGMSISAFINHLNHPLLFIFQSLRPSFRVGVFSNQAQLNRYHCSVDTKNLTHPPMQVILTIKIMAEHLFSEVFHQGLSTNLSLCYIFHGLTPNQMEIWNYLLPALALWMWVWYPLKWGFKAIQNGNEFQNGFAYCDPDFKYLLVLLPCSLTPCKWFLIAIVCFRYDWIVCLKLIWRRLSFLQQHASTNS